MHNKKAKLQQIVDGIMNDPVDKRRNLPEIV